MLWRSSASGGRRRCGRAVTRTRSARRDTAGEKPAVKRRSALRALFVGPQGQQHAVDRAARRLPSRVVLKSDSPPRLGVDRRSVRVPSISCLHLHSHARHAGYTGRRRAFGPGREPLGTRRLNPAAPPAKRRATISLDAFTGSEKEIGLMATGHSEHGEGLMPPRRPVRGAAQVRKRLRRELRRVGADGVRLYIDGPRGIARLRFPRQDRWLELAPGEALDLLRSLPNGAGAQATIDALARGS